MGDLRWSLKLNVTRNRKHSHYIIARHIITSSPGSLKPEPASSHPLNRTLAQTQNRS